MLEEVTSRPPNALDESRRLFGASTAPWAALRLEMDDHSWLALSGSGKPDYNLGLVYGGDPAARVAEMLESIKEAAVPSIIMLAGAGLAAGQVLADAGWVCLSALPFMSLDSPGFPLEPDVRELTRNDLDEARELAAAAFGIGPDVAGLVFGDRALEREDKVMTGLEVDGRLVSVLLGCNAGPVTTGWGLATAPARQRAGYAMKMVTGTMALDTAKKGPRRNLCLATPRAKPLYDTLGFRTVEHWQTWSRPRWVLGGA